MLSNIKDIIKQPDSLFHCLLAMGYSLSYYSVFLIMLQLMSGQDWMELSLPEMCIHLFVLYGLFLPTTRVILYPLILLICVSLVEYSTVYFVNFSIGFSNGLLTNSTDMNETIATGIITQETECLRHNLFAAMALMILFFNYWVNDNIVMDWISDEFQTEDMEQSDDVSLTDEIVLYNDIMTHTVTCNMIVLAFLNIIVFVAFISSVEFKTMAFVEYCLQQFIIFVAAIGGRSTGFAVAFFSFIHLTGSSYHMFLSSQILKDAFFDGTFDTDIMDNLANINITYAVHNFVRIQYTIIAFAAAFVNITQVFRMRLVVKLDDKTRDFQIV